MSMTDQINRANARSRRVPSVLFRLILAWGLSGILLAIAVPQLHARGMGLQAWMIWVVIIAALGLAIGPDLVRRPKNRN